MVPHDFQKRMMTENANSKVFKIANSLSFCDDRDHISKSPKN
jgi:hypothetical protein